ncbi:hypothetical protein ACVINW_007344 [Bradyrhizobium sp. USDA 4461]
MKRSVRHLRDVLVFIALACNLAGASGADAPAPVIVPVDNVWTGTNSQFASLTVGEQAFIAYYNAQRVFSVAQIDLASGSVRRKELQASTPGWDSHDETKLALDEQGHLHVVFVNHAHPLEYFRSTSARSIADISAATMTGRNEEHITYPSFEKAGKNLLLVFRDGVSGNGAWYANIWNGTSWKRLSETPLFSDRAKGGSVSAYPTAFVRGPDGEVNVAIVWRKTPDVASNFRITFAKSRDFVSWTKANGDPILGSVNPRNSDLVDDPGEGRGLVNNAELNVTTDGTPLIAYTKFDEAGRNGVYLAYEKEGWKTLKLAASSAPIEIAGRGSLLRLPRFSQPVITNGVGRVHVTFPGEAAVDKTFDARSLGLADTKSNEAPKFQFPAISTEGLSEAVTLSSLAKQYAPSKYNVVFRWVSQGPHSDIPRSCTRLEPEACKPRPAQLQAYIFKR